MNSSTSGTDHDRLAASESAGGTSREAGRIELAREAPFRLASLEVDPPRRRVALDDGREEIIEPRVMQVLVALARSNGRIVSRDELLESCWRGVIVGEDALLRALDNSDQARARPGSAAIALSNSSMAFLLPSLVRLKCSLRPAR